MVELLNGSTADRYRTLIDEASLRVASRLQGVHRPKSDVTYAELQRLVGSVDLDVAGVGAGLAVQEIDELFLQHAVWYHDIGYVAHLNCPVALPAVAAEAMLAAVNTSVDTYDQSTVGTLIERRLIEWIAHRVGFGTANGVFTSGGTLSNLHALFLAREAALSALDMPRSAALSRMVILATADSHFSVGKAALILGLDADGVVEVARDELGRMDPGALVEAHEEVIASGRIPIAVVATAGTTDRGAIDPLNPIADVCDSYSTWLHVDAAYGCGLLVSPSRRHLLAGIERAWSVTADFHKSFFQPVSSSVVLVRDAGSFSAGAWHADYLNPAEEDAEPNQVDVSFQTTRRFDALKLWVTLRADGPDRIGELFDRVIDLAQSVSDEIAGDSRFELVARSQLSTVLFRVCPEGTSETTHDALVARVRRVLFESGSAIVAKTTFEGRPCLKFTFLNPTSTIDDVRAILERIVAAAASLLPLSPSSPSSPSSATGVDPVVVLA